MPDLHSVETLPTEVPGDMSSAAPRLTVIGTGYLGATHAICMALLGFDVLGVDVVQEKVDRLNAGEVPFFEPGLPECLTKALETGRLRFTTDYAQAAAFGDVHFLCVGTPQRAGSQAADLTYVDAAVSALAPHLDRRALVVGKSTVPVGTAARLTELLQSLAPAGDQVELAWNPEFLREGYAVEDTMSPDRLVFGVASDWAEQQLRLAFAPVLDAGTPLVVTDLATAELVKAAADSFLATKISYINAMAEICEVTGADVNDLAAALAHDSRIGGRFLHPGLDFGGGCLPKDIRAFAHRAEELGVGQAVAFLHEVDAINQRRRERTVDLVRELVGGDLVGKRIAALTMTSHSTGAAAGSAGASAGSGTGTGSATGAGPDLACGKPTTASSSAGAANQPSNATACPAAGAPWISGAGAAPQTLQVDLGGAETVDHLVLSWGAAYAVRFKVRTSTDGTGWHTAAEVTDGTGGTQTVALPSATNARWVQLYLERAATGTTFGVAQFAVYALPASASASSSGAAAAGTGPSSVSTAPGSATALWTGQFAGFGTAAWKSAWGYTSTGQFGMADLSEVADPAAPGGGSALRVYYGAGSSANSCKDCPSVGGGQFYQQLSSLGSVGTGMASSDTLDLKYSIKLPAGWDFGEAGKLPGLYGGVIGQESGGNHGADGWSTRYMFRNHGGSPDAGEIYLYTPTNSGPTGYGVDYFGTWNWTSDGAWHTVEQLVNRKTGSVTVWFDGKQVLDEPNIATGIAAIPFSGVFFSTFFGGHDTTWGPKVAEYSYFADFSLSTGIQH